MRLVDGFYDYPGMWIGVKDGRILEVRRTPDEVVEALHRKNVVGALVMRVPAEHDKELVGLG